MEQNFRTEVHELELCAKQIPLVSRGAERRVGSEDPAINQPPKMQKKIQFLNRSESNNFLQKKRCTSKCKMYFWRFSIKPRKFVTCMMLLCVILQPQQINTVEMGAKPV